MERNGTGTGTELRALRDRYAGLDAAMARAEAAVEADAQCVLQAVALRSEGAYPTAGGLFFSALPQVVTGPEKEGGTPAFAAAAQPVYPYVPGSSAPAAGTRAVAALVPYRWVLSKVRDRVPTTVKGSLFGCFSKGTAGTVEVFDAATMTLLGSGPAVDGVYSLSISLAANTSCVIKGTPSTSRLTAYSTTVALLAGATNTVNLFCGVASGYHCLTMCPIPLADTIHITGVTVPNIDHSDGGTHTCSEGLPDDTLTYTDSPPAGYTGAGNGWYGAATFAYQNQNGIPESAAKYLMRPHGIFVLVFTDGGFWEIVTDGFTVNCPPAFLWQASCDPSINGQNLGGTITE